MSKRTLTPEERAQKEKAKRERLAKLEADTKRKKLAAAGVEWDARTAQGRREFDVVGTGRAMRASVNHLNNCLRQRGDRTNARTLAWSSFDTHMHKVKVGEIAAPRYEPGVDASTTPGVADSRLDALREDSRLKAYLGTDYHDLLVAVIYHQRTYRDLARNQFEAQNLAYMFKRALDRVAEFWRIGEDSDRARKMRRALFTATPEGQR